MTINARPFAGDADLPRIAELIGTTSGKTPHRIDFPWRLSSPTLQNVHDVRLWVDDEGLVGFAAWQSYWAALDYYVRPGPAQSEVEDAVFAWAAARFRELDRERGQPLPYWIEARDDDAERLAVAARYGFTLDDDYSYVMLSRSLVDPLPQPPLPDGFAIRPLKGAAEAGDYTTLHQAAFDSTSMTPGWRARTLRSPQYRANLDLVAVAPGGELAGFCVCWLATSGHLGQIEPIGVHPDFQQQGLSQALLAECFRRLVERGAVAALVETESSRSPARRAYEAIGFRVAHTVLRKGRWMEG